MLGDEAPTFFKVLERPPTKGLRVNTLKVSVRNFKTLTNWHLDPVPWSATGFVLKDEPQAGKHPYHAAGLYYLQDPSAMAVAELAQPDKGQWVIDLAAAPGGKATHLASLMQDSGLLVANDVHKGRAKALSENLERWGVKNALISSSDIATLAKLWGAHFDRVLLDAPCSGEGMFRKSDNALSMWSEDTVLACAKRQHELIAEAAMLVKPGGNLIYSTCTFSIEENEDVLTQFLDKHKSFELLTSSLVAIQALKDSSLPYAGKTVRLFPHHHVGEGHFVAVLERKEGEVSRLKKATLKPVPKAVHSLWKAFMDKIADAELVDKRLALFGKQLYALPETVPTLDKLYFLKAGLWLGTVHKNWFEPSHSLALSFSRENAKRLPHYDLIKDSLELDRYLRGEVLEAAGEQGWVLITVDGFPVGWAKRSATVLKNAYPKGLRRV